MLLLDQRVPVPVHGVLKQSRGDNTYVYCLMDSYKKENGGLNTSRKRKMIGRVVKGSEGLYMYPNEAYYEVYKLDKPEIDYAKTAWPGRKATIRYQPGTVFRPGFPVACRLALLHTGLSPLLEKHFGKRRADQLSMLACNSLLGESAGTNIDFDAALNSVWEGADGLTSQAVSRLLEDISSEELRDFFTDWVPLAAGDDTLAYDVTAFTSKAARMELAELGYTHGTVENEPLVNFALFCNQRTEMPVFFTDYSGSLNDKSNLTHVVSRALDRGLPGSITLVMDRGMTSRKNLQYMQSAGLRFICGVPGTIRDVSVMMEDFGRSNNVTDGGFTVRCASDKDRKGEERELLTGVTRRLEWNGISLDVHLYRSEQRAAQERLNLVYGIELCREHLEKHGSLPDDKFLTQAAGCFEKQGQGRGRHWELNKEKADSLSNTAGCFALFSSPELNLTAREALELYRRREVDEKCFDSLKNDLGGLPLRIHSDSRLDGRFFVLFLALCMKKYLMERTKPLLRKLNRDYTFMVKVLRNCQCEFREKTVQLGTDEENRPIIVQYTATLNAYTRAASSLLSCIAGEEISKELDIRDTISPRKTRKAKGKDKASKSKSKVDQ